MRWRGCGSAARGMTRTRVLVDLAVMLADGGEAIGDLAVLRDQPDLFGPVAPTATAWRVLDAIDCREGLQADRHVDVAQDTESPLIQRERRVPSSAQRRLPAVTATPRDRDTRHRTQFPGDDRNRLRR